MHSAMATHFSRTLSKHTLGKIPPLLIHSAGGDIHMAENETRTILFVQYKKKFKIKDLNLRLAALKLSRKFLHDISPGEDFLNSTDTLGNNYKEIMGFYKIKNLLYTKVKREPT